MWVAEWERISNGARSIKTNTSISDCLSVCVNPKRKAVWIQKKEEKKRKKKLRRKIWKAETGFCSSIPFRKLKQHIHSFFFISCLSLTMEIYVYSNSFDTHTTTTTILLCIQTSHGHEFLGILKYGCTIWTDAWKKRMTSQSISYAFLCIVVVEYNISCIYVWATVGFWYVYHWNKLLFLNFNFLGSKLPPESISGLI